MEDLEELALAYCSITDKALAHIQQMPSLKCLNLNFTGVSDDGVDDLCRITTLEDILIGDTGITPEGARRLTEAFPNARIYH
jgi:hypothetical protein